MFTQGNFCVTQEGINKFITCDGIDLAEVYELWNPDTAHFNARLFSAAPELLKALECAKQALSEWRSVCPEYITQIDHDADKLIELALTKCK
jgi:hypothetical protein